MSPPKFCPVQVLPGQALPPGIREQLNGPVILPSMYLRCATRSFQVPFCSQSSVLFEKQ